MNNPDTRILFATLLIAATLTGCGGGYGGGRQADYPVYQTDVRQATDNATAARVRRALAADVRVGAETLTVKVVDGVVELGGSPKDLQARDLAFNIARRVYGVKAVVNNMTFL